jgi:DNA-directed RNA polymerase subunit RPC12/RpoP
MDTKICTKCGKNLPIEEFNWRNKTKGTRRSECKYCHSQYMKKVYQKKKNDIQELKAKCACAKCGEQRGYVLDFHHINPLEKENTVARMTSNNYTLEKVYEEIEKCIVLCANCHREFHYLENQNNNFTIKDYL